MKTKRLKKLLMGMGLSRDQVNYMVHDQRTTGDAKISNAVYYYYAKRYIAELTPDWLPLIKSFVLGDASNDDLEHTCGECKDFGTCGNGNAHYAEDSPACRGFRPAKRPARAANTDEPKGDGYSNPHRPKE